MMYTDYTITADDKQYYLVVDKIVIASSPELSNFVGHPLRDIISYLRRNYTKHEIRRVVVTDFVNT